MTDEELLRERERLLTLYDKARHVGRDLYAGFEFNDKADDWPTYQQSFVLASAVLLLASGSLLIAPDAVPESRSNEIWRNIHRLRDMSEKLYTGYPVPYGEVESAQFVVSYFKADRYHGMIGLDASTLALSSMVVHFTRSKTFDVANFPAVDSWTLAAAGWELLLGWNKHSIDSEQCHWIRPNEKWISQAKGKRVENQMRKWGQSPPSMN